MNRREFLERSACVSTFGLAMWQSRLAAVAHASPPDLNGEFDGTSGEALETIRALLR